MKDYILLTGATGLLGRYLLRDLLSRGRKVVVVVRPTKHLNVRERIEQILQQWESESNSLFPRPVVFEGDICAEFLGLNDTQRQWIADNCSSVLHSAATLTFHSQKNGEPWRTNVGGTEHMLQLCEVADIRELHYVSTAYVCGLRAGTIQEDELDCGQDFRNDYEQSKLQSETLVRSAKHIDCLTVYRPAVIAGDSVTGFTNTYHGLYMYLHMMSVVNRNTTPDADGRRHTPIRLKMTGDEPRNIITADWTSAAIVELLLNDQAHGHTFHLAPEKPLTPREIMEAGYEYFNSYGVEFYGQPISSDGAEDLLTRNAHDSMKMYKQYEQNDPCFDTTNLKRFAGHLPCPAIDKPMLHRFWAYGEEDRWGKRRLPKPTIPFDASELMAMAREYFAATEATSDPLTTVGLNVSGPGGGQWSIDHNATRIIKVRPGIAANVTKVVTLTSEQLASRLSHGQSKTEIEKLLAVAFERATSPAPNTPLESKNNGDAAGGRTEFAPAVALALNPGPQQE